MNKLRYRERLQTPVDHVIATDLELASGELLRARAASRHALRELKRLARRATRRGWSERQIAAFAGVSSVAIHQWKGGR